MILIKIKQLGSKFDNIKVLDNKKKGLGGPLI